MGNKKNKKRIDETEMEIKQYMYKKESKSKRVLDMRGKYCLQKRGIKCW
jgi:hypothetical protein